MPSEKWYALLAAVGLGYTHKSTSATGATTVQKVSQIASAGKNDVETSRGVQST